MPHFSIGDRPDRVQFSPQKKEGIPTKRRILLQGKFDLTRWDRHRIHLIRASNPGFVKND